jgi:hypothetical protein
MSASKVAKSARSDHSATPPITVAPSNSAGGKLLKLLIDLSSVVFVAYLLLIAPIWSHYQPASHTHGGALSILVKLGLADVFPAAFGVVWLAYRYAGPINKRYPFMFTQKPRSKVRFVIGFLSVYLMGYLILKNLLWR